MKPIKAKNMRDAERIAKENGSGWTVAPLDAIDSEGYQVREWFAVPPSGGMSLDEAKRHLENAPLFGLGWEKIKSMQAKKNPLPAFKRKDIEAGKRLGERFSGHRFDKLRIARRRTPGTVRVEIGAVSGIMYLAKRDGKVGQYFHRFAAGSRPLLTVSPDGKTLELLGGAFRFTERGIVDDPRAMVKRK